MGYSVAGVLPPVIIPDGHFDLARRLRIEKVRGFEMTSSNSYFSGQEDRRIRGEEIYRSISDKLEGEHAGEFVVIEVTGGDYFSGKTLSEALTKARKEYPQGSFFPVHVNRHFRDSKEEREMLRGLIERLMILSLLLMLVALVTLSFWLAGEQGGVASIVGIIGAVLVAVLMKHPLQIMAGLLLLVSAQFIFAAFLIEGWQAGAISIIIAVSLTYIIYRFRPVFTVKGGTVVLASRFGQLETLPPGQYLHLPFGLLVPVKEMPTSLLVFESEPQRVLTKNVETVTLQLVVHYRIMRDPSSGQVDASAVRKAAFETRDFQRALQIEAISVLHELLGGLALKEQILDFWSEVRRGLQEKISEEAKRWGIEITRVALRNIQLEQDTVDSLLAEDRARRRAAVERIRADGERDAARSLAEAGLSSEDLLTLRYIEALKELADSDSTKLVLPYEAGEVMKRIRNIVEELAEEA